MSVASCSPTTCSAAVTHKLLCMSAAGRVQPICRAALTGKILCMLVSWGVQPICSAAASERLSACLQQGGHNPSALDFLADVANSAGNYPGDTSKGTAAAAAASAGTGPVNGILKVCPQLQFGHVHSRACVNGMCYGPTCTIACKCTSSVNKHA